MNLSPTTVGAFWAEVESLTDFLEKKASVYTYEDISRRKKRRRRAAAVGGGTALAAGGLGLAAVGGRAGLRGLGDFMENHIRQGVESGIKGGLDDLQKRLPGATDALYAQLRPKTDEIVDAAVRRARAEVDDVLKDAVVTAKAEAPEIGSSIGDGMVERFKQGVRGRFGRK